MTWLGALPDALKKLDDSDADTEQIFGEKITVDSFENLECNEKYANARCYTMVSKESSKVLSFERDKVCLCIPIG